MQKLIKTCAGWQAIQIERGAIVWQITLVTGQQERYDAEHGIRRLHPTGNSDASRGKSRVERMAEVSSR